MSISKVGHTSGHVVTRSVASRVERAVTSLAAPRSKVDGPLSDDESIWDRAKALFGAGIDYSGDWNLSPEWFGSQGGGWGRTEGKTLFSEVSEYNGVVSVTAHPASPIGKQESGASVEWRVLRFNDKTRQSVVRLVNGNADSACLATEYLKTVVAIFAAVIDLNRETSDGQDAFQGDQVLEMDGGSCVGPRVLCIGVGGGSIVQFLSSFFPEMEIDAVEIDPVVATAARDFMGMHSNIYVEDAREFVARLVTDNNNNKKKKPYDIVYIDAFDGDDCIPSDLCTDHFARSLSQVTSKSGTVIINMHESDTGRPLTARVFHEALGGESFTITCKTQRNVILCCSRSIGIQEAVTEVDEKSAKEMIKSAAARTRADKALPFHCGSRAIQGFSRIP
jgi:spermidine synthase